VAAKLPAIVHKFSFAPFTYEQLSALYCVSCYN